MQFHDFAVEVATLEHGRSSLVTLLVVQGPKARAEAVLRRPLCHLGPTRIEEHRGPMRLETLTRLHARCDVVRRVRATLLDRPGWAVEFDGRGRKRSRRYRHRDHH